jgi:Dolichyl-phosphate-mannose-protein mannosyltransferase
LITSSFHHRREIVGLILLTLLVTGLNAIKPLHMDDGAFYANAVQSANHPLDPYGFTAFWAQWPEPGNWAVCPPMLPYWWSFGIHLFGDSPVMWKLWLLPLVAVFVFSLHSLFRRFSPGMEMPLVWMTALSPAFLPALNLMLDIPAMGLGLGAICLAMKATDKGSAMWAAFAGVVAGIAIETKYTAAVVPALIFVWAVLHRRWWLGVLSGLIAGGIFVICEGLIAHRYGMSHFMFHLGLNDSMKGTQSKEILWTAMPLLIGGLAPVIALLALAAFNFPSKALLVVGLMIVGEYAVIWPWPIGVQSFLVAGIFVIAVMALAVRGLDVRRDREDAFIVLWLALEVVAFEAISPFAASRRAMGLVLAMTLVVGRFAWRRHLMRDRPGRVRGIVALSIVLGMGFYALDLTDALGEKHAVQRAGALVAAQPGETVWFTGHWGFQFYALQRGYDQVVPDHSVLRRGDWLIYPHAGIESQRVVIPLAMVDEVGQVWIDDAVRMATVPYYYGSGVPVQHRFLPRVLLSVYRVRDDFVPLTSYSPQYLAQWAIDRGRPLPAASIAAVLRAIPQVDAATGMAAMKAIRASEQSGPIRP